MPTCPDGRAECPLPVCIAVYRQGTGLLQAMSIQNIGDLETLYGFVTKTDRKHRF